MDTETKVDLLKTIIEATYEITTDDSPTCIETAISKLKCAIDILQDEKMLRADMATQEERHAETF